MNLQQLAFIVSVLTLIYKIFESIKKYVIHETREDLTDNYYRFTNCDLSTSEKLKNFSADEITSLYKSKIDRNFKIGKAALMLKKSKFTDFNLVDVFRVENIIYIEFSFDVNSLLSPTTNFTFNYLNEKYFLTINFIEANFSINIYGQEYQDQNVRNAFISVTNQIINFI